VIKPFVKIITIKPFDKNIAVISLYWDQCLVNNSSRKIRASMVEEQLLTDLCKIWYVMLNFQPERITPWTRHANIPVLTLHLQQQQ